jgi:uncharacterized protein YndB with AHSA1/START domain
MKTFLAFFIATTYGVVLRFLFNYWQNIMPVFSFSLLILAPAIVGYLAVFFYGLKGVSSKKNAFFTGVGAILILSVMLVFLDFEGLICVVIIFPIMGFLGGIGGFLAYQHLLEKGEKSLDNPNKDQDPDENHKNILKLSPLMTLPLVLGAIEQDRLLSPSTYIVSQEIKIDAPPARVWDALTTIELTEKHENYGFWAEFFNLPHHISTEMDVPKVGGIRTAYYERGLFFKETITEFQPEKRMTVSIHADPGSVPSTVLDEHVVIGGRYFRALEDTYQLTVLPDGKCLLKLSGCITVNTPFNWYASIWARWLLSDIFENLLKTIEKRAI